MFQIKFDTKKEVHFLTMRNSNSKWTFILESFEDYDNHTNQSLRINMANGDEEANFLQFLISGLESSAMLQCLHCGKNFDPKNISSLLQRRLDEHLNSVENKLVDILMSGKETENEESFQYDIEPYTSEDENENASVSLSGAKYVDLLQEIKETLIPETVIEQNFSKFSPNAKENYKGIEKINIGFPKKIIKDDDDVLCCLKKKLRTKLEKSAKFPEAKNKPCKVRQTMKIPDKDKNFHEMMSNISNEDSIVKGYVKNMEKCIIKNISKNLVTPDDSKHRNCFDELERNIVLSLEENFKKNAFKNKPHFKSIDETPDFNKLNGKYFPSNYYNIRKTTRMKTLLKHIWENTKAQDGYDCKNCKKRYCRCKGLRIHEQTRNNISAKHAPKSVRKIAPNRGKQIKFRQFYCRFCPNPFTQEEGLFNHELKIHPNLKFCYLCKKSFTRSFSLQRHERVFHRKYL